jgi:hypothetical protein
MRRTESIGSNAGPQVMQARRFMGFLKTGD